VSEPVLAIADFEDLGLAPGAYWDGSDESGGFVSSGVFFTNSYNAAWFSWEGFSYSSVNDTNTAGYGNQYASFGGTGVGNTGTYAVAYINSYAPQNSTITLPCPSLVGGFYLNNDTYPAISMRDGDAFAKKFGGVSGDDEDWFLLTVAGLDSGGNSLGTVNFHLADYRFTNNALDYIVSDWQWVDLTCLGSAVKQLRFSLSSSDVGVWGMNTPAYFVFDNLTILPDTPSNIVHLDELYLDPDLYWNGVDEAGGFVSGGLVFNNNFDTNWSTWDGFAYSRVNDTNTSGSANQYAAWSGTGVNSTGNYAVGYVNAWAADKPHIDLPAPTRVDGFYANNSTYAALSMRDGDAFAKQFGGTNGLDPDWFMLTVTGKDSGSNELATVDFYLADYRAAGTSNDYIISDWTYVDLSGLGPKVKSLHFSLSSSDVGPWGMNTPAYFALDNLVVKSTFASGTAADWENPHDPGIPGYVGSDGDGATGGANFLNAAFGSWGGTVLDYSPAPDVDSQWANPSNALGPATGDNMDIVSLGDLDAGQLGSNVPPGQITVGFDIPVADRNGSDFAVFENGLSVGDSVFAELGYVEVSSDGTNFARFPSMSLTTNLVGAYGSLDPRDVNGLCGKNRNGGGASWGTPFDLAEISYDPLVLNGVVNLTNINFVRVVDIPGSGDFTDTANPSNEVYDAWVTWGSGGVDLEAIGVINSPSLRKILVAQATNGMISPYGLPNGYVSVLNGSNVTFAVTPDTGYRTIDVIVDGQSVGITNSVSFQNVTDDHAVTARFAPDTHAVLRIASPYGAVQPETGVHSYEAGAGITGIVANSPIVSADTQLVCFGWSGTGSAPTSGAGTNTGAFALTNDSDLAWLWSTNYRFSVSTDPGGAVSSTTGWYQAGSVVTSAAAVGQYYYFTGWRGDTQGNTNDPVTTNTMQRGCSVIAGFAPDMATNNTPEYWLAGYDLTNSSPDDEAMDDQDSDGVPTWMECRAGTDPMDADSSFKFIDQGMENGSNYVTWLGGTNGSELPFSVYRSTNLATGWELLNGSIQKSPTGTNTWWDTNDVSHIPVFYRIEVREE